MVAFKSKLQNAAQAKQQSRLMGLKSVANLDPELPNLCMVSTCTWRNTLQTWAVTAHCPLPVAA